MNNELYRTISNLAVGKISDERQVVLQPLIDYLNGRIMNGHPINLNFICTHNSRRSIFSQVWAQTMAYYFKLDQIRCYSGGTESTAVFPKVVEMLTKQGFEVNKMFDSHNPIYAIKCNHNLPAMICFSKEYNHFFNPNSDFVAIMTCDHADENCPVISGADVRFRITYSDPKVFDHTAWMDSKYQERSLEIANEMYYIFSHLLKK